MSKGLLKILQNFYTVKDTTYRNATSQSHISISKLVLVQPSFALLSGVWENGDLNLVKTSKLKSKCRKKTIFLDLNQNPFVQICKLFLELVDISYFYQQIVFVLMINRRKGQLILEKKQAKIILRVRR